MSRVLSPRDERLWLGLIVHLGDGGWRGQGGRLVAADEGRRHDRTDGQDPGRPTANARWLPLSWAMADGWPLERRFDARVVAMETSTASPKAPPTCWAVVTMPEASPASASLASETAATVMDTKAKPAPTASSTMAGTI